MKTKYFTILIAEDDEEDRMLTEDAIEETDLRCQLQFVEDGEQAMEYLLNKGSFENKTKYPAPRLILLDLNMPKKDGREVLAEIRQHDALRAIPVIALTTSNSPEDISLMYELGVNSYITKPVSFAGMIKAMNGLKQFWFEIVSLPK